MQVDLSIIIGLKIERRQSSNMGQTLSEKIISKNIGKQGVKSGEIVIVKPDKMMFHDDFAPFILQKLKEMGYKAFSNPDNVVLIFDHLLPTNQAKDNPRHYNTSIFMAKEYNINNVHVGEGICHTIMHERNHIEPGMLIIGADSHTVTYGGAACFSTGVGYTEMAGILGSGEMWMKVPESIKIVINGNLPLGVYSKDIILKIIGDIGADGAIYKSLEFSGNTIEKLSMDARFTMANMAVEAGAKNGIFEADKKTAEYFNIKYDKLKWLKVGADEDYCSIINYSAKEIQPQVSCPDNVDNVYSIEDVEGINLNEVFLGSCTNGSIEDLAVAANILHNKKINNFIKMVIIPASVKIYKKAIKRGYIETFIRAGAIVSHPCCGLCCGQPYGLLSDGEAVLGTNNRNFLGRMGTNKSKIYLSSPATAAASAITGKITDPRHFL